MTRRVQASAALLTLLAALQASAVSAQTAPAPPEEAPRPTGALQVSAVFAGDQKPIRSGLVWRVFEERGEGPPALVARSDQPAPSWSLPPGPYLVHAAYGYAGASRRVLLAAGTVTERLAVSAGGLVVAGVVGDAPIPGPRLTFSVYVPMGTNSEGRLVVQDAKGGEIIRLPEGAYHVVSTYGESNAIMRADLKVDSGKVTEATLNHRAATVTLKLVAAAGGEAFAGTAFSVLTPGGDVIREAIGAFPQVTLAEGDYMLIARHEGQVYTREFKVESGLDRDIEVLAKAK